MRHPLSAPSRTFSFPRAFVIPAALAAFGASAQTVIINEVSNGPAGNQEFVELVVVPTDPVDPCEPRPCLDLRGWIFDDNNGYHGSGGTAPGAMRFSTNTLWSCVPVGTIIAIYNDGDPDPNLPPDDVSLTDGNCSIVVGAGNSTFFEFTPITPAAALCSNPGGWGTDGSPTWMNNLALANTGDCARICDPEGCEVFNFCYGSVGSNATVYISGSGGQRVWGFGDGDPYSAGDWWYGSANGANPQQTPGAPNNAANEAWIGQFNDNCTPPTTAPLTVSAEATAACGCTATATATAEGSVPGYVFTWYDADWNDLGQSSAVATGLCSGVHHVIATSSVGCEDTATVSITALDPPDAGSDGGLTLCASDGPVDLFTLLGGTPDAGGSWTPALNSGTGSFDPTLDPPGNYTYTVAGQAPCPDATAVVQVTVTAPPVVDITTQSPSCWNSTDGSILLAPQGTGPFTYTWADGTADAERTGIGAGTYSVDVSGPDQCTAMVTIPLTAPPPIIISIATVAATCGLPNGQVCATAMGGSGELTVDWADPVPTTNGCIQGIAAGNWTATVTDENGCSAQTTAIVNDIPSSTTISVTTFDVSCWGLSDGALAASLNPPTDDLIMWQRPDGSIAIGNALDGIPVGNYSGTVTDAEGCVLSMSASIGTPASMNAEVSTSDEICANACDGAAQLNVTGGTPPFTLLDGSTTFPNGHLNGLCAGDQVITVLDAHQCALDVPVTIAPGSIVVNPLLGPLPILCSADDAVTLSATPLGGTWSGAGIVDGTLGIFDPSQVVPGPTIITYALPGICSTPAMGSLDVVGVPDASFSVLQNVGPEQISFTADLDGASQYIWWLNGVTVSDGPQWTWDAGDDTNSNAICLSVTNGPGCADTACRMVTAEYVPDVFIPNAFTPNDDDINEHFVPVIDGAWPQSVELSIFDRWGRPVFKGSSPTGWDGTVHGSPAEPGIYSWRFSYQVPGNDRRTLMGHVTLLR